MLLHCEERAMSRTRSSLLEQIRDLGDSRGWERFDELYRPMLFRYARDRGLSLDEAEEIVQECMTAMVEGIQRFERKASFRGWLRGMVDNKVADQIRKRNPERQGFTRDFARPQERERSPAELWEREWNRAHLLQCLAHVRAEVSEHTFRAFQLYVLEGLPVSEISRRLGMTANQIYVAKSRVMTRIEERSSELLSSTAQSQSDDAP
jgi:RNA polymerase sigma-70 factor (ECF subfamily)